MPTAAFPPVRIGTVGLRNYGAYVCKLLEEHGRLSDAAARLTAVGSTPNAPQETVERLRAAGVRVVDGFDALLQEDIEAVWIPFPIDLHREFTAKALAAGKAVMCEKPVAGSVEEVDAMIADAKRSDLPVAIGYQDIYHPTTMRLKKRLLSGEIGRLRSIVTHAAGPRGDAYYGRAPWCGKFRREGRWVIDAIANNAHAHEINLAFFLAGATPERAAQPVSVEAELYRSNPIETFDTAAMRLETDTGVSVLVLQTHACEFFVDSLLVIEGEKGRVYRTRGLVVIEREGSAEVLKADEDARHAMVRRFAQAVRGLPHSEIALATPETSRGQVAAVNGALEAARIVEIPSAVKRTPKTLYGICHAVVGMEALLSLCARRGVMFHESGLFPWTVSPERKTLRDYTRFSGPKA
ncbi:MAG: Gfo/Idh/MocA family oxidoreductase [Verrucomicrobiae bacterium]|nr:Gfo/Idh/MocA family oxidoreductase [Verrucomicrobiae bacterium]